MIYDLTPETIVETEGVLSVEDVEDARRRLERGETPGKVAARLGGKVFEQPEERPPAVMVDPERLREELGSDEAVERVLAPPPEPPPEP